MMNIENKKQIAIILLAIGLGLVASVLTGNYINKSIQGERKKLAEQIEAKSLKPLKQEILRMRKEITELKKRPTTVIQPTEKKREERSSLPKSSLALRTPAGKRAVTVRVDSLSAVGGMVNPGDFIDIFANLDMPNPETGKTTTVSSMVFQNIQILAVGTNLQNTGGYEKQQAARALNLTLALTPEEAGLMAFIQSHGKMKLFLRAPAETETEILQTATWSSLADYVFEKQGTELAVPRQRTMIQPLPTEDKEEVKPFIQIFQGGQQL